MNLLLSEPVENVITRFYAQPERRGGERAGRLWWVCPFHDDHNPSLCVDPGEWHYHCFGCGAHGDAIDFVRRLKPDLSSADAVRAIEGTSRLDLKRAIGNPKPVARIEPGPRPEGWQQFASDLVETAESALWLDQGVDTRIYLANRGLTEETIHRARLGFNADDQWVRGIFPDQAVFVPRGIVIPWPDGPDMGLINVRRAEGQPKYVAVKGSRGGGIYPGRLAIVTGKPLVIVEGEFDALLLGQELDGLVSVVTLGSAGFRPRPIALNAMLRASPWVIATDADDAGNRSAEDWLAITDRSVRVTPPKELGKDWTDAYQNGLDLRDWWARTLAELAGKPDPSPENVSPEPDPTEEIVECPPEPYIPFEVVGPNTNRWRCLSRFCLNKGQWWMSVYGVVLCRNCRPPAFPWLVVAEGDAMLAPFVDPGRSNQATLPRPSH
jgi:hypothetical protein